jgi:enoyl-CoA hydratase
LIQCSSQDRVVTVTIDRPEKRNALNTALCTAIRTAVQDAVADGARALVLTGNGSSFCSGADLDGVHSAEFRSALHDMLQAVVAAPVPVVAAVNGPAIGAGTQLAIAADLRVVAPTARFAVPTAKLGLAVDPWTIARLAQLAGHGQAGVLLLACDELDASGALACGLADRAGDLDVAAGWAARMAELAPLTLAYNKLALHALPGSAAGAEVVAAFERCWSSADVAEGQRARVEKRRPVFRGE